MKLKITKTSWMDDKCETNPLKDTSFESKCQKDESTAEVTYNCGVDKYGNECSNEVAEYCWYLEIDTLEELFELMREVKEELVLHGKTIEIYDSYRE